MSNLNVPQDDIPELLVRSQLALHMLQVDFSAFLGVSDRTMRRWLDGGTRLSFEVLHKLVNAVHPADASLAGRIAAYHGLLLEELLRPLPPVRDRAADRRLAEAIVRSAAQATGVTSRAMRDALLAALGTAHGAGLTIEEVHGLVEELDEDGASGSREGGSRALAPKKLA
jgi:hypothetical protein